MSSRVAGFIQYIFVLFILFGGLSEKAYGWSGKGHSFMAVSAFQHLDGDTQIKITTILKVGPWSKNQKTPTAEWLVNRASNWPDWIRNKKLISLFVDYGSGAVPAVLKPYANQNTRDWHFVNALFLTQQKTVVEAGPKSSSANCPPKFYGRLFEVWPLLFQAYAQANDIRDKAILLAFILHFGSDAYQPLHVYSALDSHCEHDRGGNAFCVSPPVGLQLGFKQCKQKLHQLWDGGFDYFNQAVSKGAAPIFIGDVQNLESVLIALKPFLTDVYPSQPADVLSQQYRIKALSVVEHTVPLGVSHLVASLSFLERPLLEKK